MKKNKKQGLNLIELLVSLIAVSIILLGSIQMLNSLFINNADYNHDIKAKQANLSASERIVNKIREASGVYNEGETITIPTENDNISVTIGNNAIAVFVPAFDSSGNIIQPTSSTSSFTGIAYSIIPESDWNGGTSGKHVLIETIFPTNLTVASSDPMQINQTYPSVWNGANSYLIAEKLVPANLSNMGQTAFDIEGKRLDFALVPTPDAIYFGSDSGTKNINDAPYLTSVVFRNFRED